MFIYQGNGTFVSDMRDEVLEFNLEFIVALKYRPCGLVVRVLGYRSRGQGSIPGTTRKKLVKLRCYLMEK
jgi:hypothetical protein